MLELPHGEYALQVEVFRSACEKKKLVKGLPTWQLAISASLLVRCRCSDGTVWIPYCQNLHVCSDTVALISCLILQALIVCLIAWNRMQISIQVWGCVLAVNCGNTSRLVICWRRDLNPDMYTSKVSRVVLMSRSGVFLNIGWALWIQWEEVSSLRRNISSMPQLFKRTGNQTRLHWRYAVISVEFYYFKRTYVRAMGPGLVEYLCILHILGYLCTTCALIQLCCFQ